jgi:hypothetical protein
VINSKRERWAGNVARMGGKRNAYKFMVENCKRKTQHRRLRRKWEDNME